MPRPKPPEPLIPWSVRLTEKNIAALRRLGGSTWLRDMISRHDKGKAAIALRKERDRRMRIDRVAGMTTEQLVKKYGVSLRTAQRALGGKK
jgi:hypothetical protein